MGFSRALRCGFLTLAMVTSLSGWSQDSHAATWQVPNQIPTIQAAIDTAANGDSVLVAPGSYTELLTVSRKNIVLTSETGASQTFIQPPASRPVGTSTLVLEYLLDTSEVSGLTFENGGDSLVFGGAVACDSCHTNIRDNSFISNLARFGGGVYVGSQPSFPTIENNYFESNTAVIQGGGLSAFLNGEPVVTGNLFKNNVSIGNAFFQGVGGAISIDNLVEDSTDVVIDHNIFIGNRACQGTAIQLEYGSPVVLSNTMVSNYAAGTLVASDVSTVYSHRGASPEISNNIIFDGQGTYGIGHDDAGIPMLTCNDLFDNDLGNYINVSPGAFDFYADPLFCNLGMGDLTLSISSLCLPANNPQCGLVGALSQGCSEQAGVKEGELIGLRVVSAPGRIDFFFNDDHSDDCSALNIFSVSGRLIKSIEQVCESKTSWFGETTTGITAPSGIYYASIQKGEVSWQRQFVFLKR